MWRLILAASAAADSVLRSIWPSWSCRCFAAALQQALRMTLLTLPIGTQHATRPVTRCVDKLLLAGRLSRSCTYLATTKTRMRTDRSAKPTLPVPKRNAKDLLRYGPKWNRNTPASSIMILKYDVILLCMKVHSFPAAAQQLVFTQASQSNGGIANKTVVQHKSSSAWCGGPSRSVSLAEVTAEAYVKFEYV